MSNKAQIERFCAANHIRIETLPSGSIRFTGPGVDVTVTRWEHISRQDLQRYEPHRKRHFRLGLTS